jgi:hypothetical protein
MTKKRLKIYLIAVVILILGLLCTWVTLAFFTSRDEVTNTQVSNAVEIQLLEPLWDKGDFKKAQVYEPGMIINKDPCVYVNGEADVYFRIKFTITDASGNDLSTFEDTDGKLDTKRYYAILNAIYCKAGSATKGNDTTISDGTAENGTTDIKDDESGSANEGNGLTYGSDSNNPISTESTDIESSSTTQETTETQTEASTTDDSAEAESKSEESSKTDSQDTTTETIPAKDGYQKFYDSGKYRNSSFYYNEDDGWFYYGTYDEDNKKINYTVLKKGEVSPTLFDYIQIPILKSDYNGLFDSGFEIKIEAQAVSASEEDVEDAFNNLAPSSTVTNSTSND